MHSELLFEYPKRPVAVSVERSCRVVIVEDQGLACRGFVLCQGTSSAQPL